jgi:uncharacterized membrane protein YgdD (TMEM256/DUF423 family)
VDRIFLMLGAIAGFLGVAFGAFGAHALQGRLTSGMLGVFDTGVRYQLVHALALVAVGILAARRPTRLAAAAGWCFASGIALFSGSLYLLALTDTTSFGLITPFGGLLLLAGWACLALTAKPEA